MASSSSPPSPPPQPEKSSQLLDHYWHLRGLQRGQTVYKNQREKIRTEVCSTSPVPWTPPAVWQGPLSHRQGNGVSSSLHLSSLPVIVQSVLAEAGAKKHRCGYVFTHTDRSLLEQWQWNPHPKNNAKVTNFATERLFSVEIFALLKTQFIYASSVNTSKIILLWKKKYSKYYMENAASHFLHARHDKQKLIHISDDVWDKDNTVMEKCH